MPGKISIRDLALRLDLSPTTVSEALRGVARVGAATRERVERAASELGYRRNELVGAVMSELRRARADSFRGTLAALDLDAPSRRGAAGNRYHARVLAGATRRAEALGFRMDRIGGAAATLPKARLRRVLDARGVRGVLILPMVGFDPARLDLAGMAAIYADYATGSPAPHSICPDHYRAIMLALERVRALGYRRPGFAIQDAHDARLLHRWEAGHHVFNAHFAQGLGLRRTPPLIYPYVKGPGFDAARFRAWFEKSGCDVVIAHHAEAKRAMEEAGARVPETHGFCCLNVNNCAFPCAGLDLRPELLGERAAELLIGQILRNESGLPERPLTTTMPVDWVDGPTLRARPDGRID